MADAAYRITVIIERDDVSLAEIAIMTDHPREGVVAATEAALGAIHLHGELPYRRVAKAPYLTHRYVGDHGPQPSN